MADQEFLCRVRNDGGIVASEREPLSQYQVLQFLSIQAGIANLGDSIEVYSQDVGTGIPEDWPALAGDEGGGGGGGEAMAGLAKVANTGGALAMGDGADWTPVTWARSAAVIQGDFPALFFGSGNSTRLNGPADGSTLTALLTLTPSDALAGDAYAQIERFNAAEDETGGDLHTFQAILSVPVSAGDELTAIFPLYFENADDYYIISVKGFGATAITANAELKAW